MSRAAVTANGVPAALGIAVGPIYQRGALQNHTIYKYGTRQYIGQYVRFPLN